MEKLSRMLEHKHLIKMIQNVCRLPTNIKHDYKKRVDNEKLWRYRGFQTANESKI